MQYFGGIVPPPFALKDAIASGTLTPYMYFPHTVRLTDQEQEEWNRLSTDISRLYAQRGSAKPAPDIDSRIDLLLIKRARIAKRATGKKNVAIDVLRANYQIGQRWIVYCESLPQLDEVLQALRSIGVDAGEYHSKMTGDREQTLRRFEINGGVLVSIRCLDEGVDIPSVSHALILASSKNPREFIQRRGRVLRRASNKPLAFVHDAIVVPNALGQNEPGSAIVEGELARAVEFGRSAENPSAITDLELIAQRFGLDLGGLSEEGVEDHE
jgi:superfamily II DNA or RNA helicase